MTYEKEQLEAEESLEKYQQAWKAAEENIQVMIKNLLSDKLIEQNERWGDNIWAHDPIVWLGIIGKEYGKAWQAVLTTGVTINGELLDRTKYKAQLIDIAAVALSALQGIMLEEIDEATSPNRN